MNALLERWSGLHALAVRTLGSSDDADDVLQDVVVALCAGHETYCCERPIEPWLRAVVRHEALRLLRQRARQTRVERAYREEHQPSAPCHAVSTADLVESRDLACAVLSYVERRRPELQEFFVEHHAGGVTYKETARASGKSFAGLRSALLRLRKELVARFASTVGAA